MGHATATRHHKGDEEKHQRADRKDVELATAGGGITTKATRRRNGPSSLGLSQRGCG